MERADRSCKNAEQCVHIYLIFDYRLFWYKLSLINDGYMLSYLPKLKYFLTEMYCIVVAFLSVGCCVVINR